MNFLIFETIFSDSKHILNCPSNMSKDGEASQLHADTLFVFIIFALKKIYAI